MIRIMWGKKKIEIRRLYTVTNGKATEVKDYEAELNLNILHIQKLWVLSRAYGKGTDEYRSGLAHQVGYSDLYITKSKQGDTIPSVEGYTPYIGDISKVTIE